MAKDRTEDKAKDKTKTADNSYVDPNPNLRAAGYEAYPAKFSSNFFSATTVAKSVKNIKAAGFTRDSLLWGYYQKYAVDDPTDPNEWGDATLYQNWESSIDEAREALQKMPVDRNLPGPDPDNPTARAGNVLEHLDTAVRIALFDKHLLNNDPMDSGIEIEVVVKPQAQSSRRHKITTTWREEASNPPDPKYKYDRLTIVMTCPFGGWIGTAIWKYNGPSRFTRFTATYTVPDPPKKSGQILFLFNGLESMPVRGQIKPPAILQPVLQWTQKDGWAIRSWYVPSTYTPSFDQMPELDSELSFTKPENPAWTTATKVTKGDVLTGVIEWVNNQAYQSSFLLGGKTFAALLAPNILPLTYPVCVIEAYRLSNKRDDLVGLLTMDGLTLFREDVPGTPVQANWEVGTETVSNDKVHQGTGRLQLYKVVPSNKNTTLTFIRKKK
ncbi:hypothetical protein JEY40_22265 [Bradyrhizobium japonicum]|uniref:hypothetical protein n=1 Tax=Bradyrhizobium japonicum TaxID=375 RepID=UPI00200FD5E0|nr:hypothetical protein [Bradyrhizobium japonicum]UQD77057.1 hypothetical protein JEY40_22265 [Bradyrhizobium japonicum]